MGGWRESEGRVEGGGFARVSPSHVGSGAWTAWPTIVGGGGNPWALKLLIPFSLQRCGCVVSVCILCVCAVSEHCGPFSVLARCLRFVFCSSLSLNVVLCLCARSLPPVFVFLRRNSVCVRSIFVCFRQLSVCLRSPLCVIVLYFRVCALCLCVFRPIVCVFAQPSVCHFAAFLCVRASSLSVSAQFLWVSAALCVFPLFTIRFFSTLALLSSQWLCLCVCTRSSLWFLLLLWSNVFLKIITSEIGV